MRQTLTLLVGLSITACAPTIMQLSLAPADIEAAQAKLAAQGTGTIKGSALLRQRGGGVVTCAGNDVFLIPATESASTQLRATFGSDQGYVKRGGDKVMGGGKLVAPPQPNRHAICNAQGFFTFTSVGAGKWYIMTTVVWEAGDDYQGGTLLGTADVTEGQEIEVVLSY